MVSRTGAAGEAAQAGLQLAGWSKGVHPRRQLSAVDPEHAVLIPSAAAAPAATFLESTSAASPTAWLCPTAGTPPKCAAPARPTAVPAARRQTEGSLLAPTPRTLAHAGRVSRSSHICTEHTRTSFLLTSVRAPFRACLLSGILHDLSHPARPSSIHERRSVIVRLPLFPFPFDCLSSVSSLWNPTTVHAFIGEERECVG